MLIVKEDVKKVIIVKEDVKKGANFQGGCEVGEIIKEDVKKGANCQGGCDAGYKLSGRM